MARTLGNLQNELIVRVGDDTIDTDTSAGWLNASWQECLEYSPWSFRKNSATGTLASDTTTQTFSSIFSVTDFKRMVKLLMGTTPYGRVDWEDSFVSQSGKYAIDPMMTGIKLPGSDGGSATLVYLRDIPNLAGSGTVVSPDGSANGVPTQWATQFEEATIAGAAVRFFQNALKPGMADYWLSQRNYYLDQVLDQLTTLSTEDQISFQTPSYNESGNREF
jgi:hypothetical protein